MLQLEAERRVMKMEKCQHNFIPLPEGLILTDRDIAEREVICSICKAQAIETWLYYKTVDADGNTLHSTE
jgi:hypothetical protein